MRDNMYIHMYMCVCAYILTYSKKRRVDHVSPGRGIATASDFSCFIYVKAKHDKTSQWMYAYLSINQWMYV